MNTIRVWTVRVIVLVVAMVAAIGGWEAYKAKWGMEGQALAASTLLDHLTCYVIIPQDTTTKELSVSNQLDKRLAVGGPPVPQTINTRQTRYLCVPSTKITVNGQPVAPDPNGIDNLPHFKCYMTTGSTLINKYVNLVDEFDPTPTSGGPAPGKNYLVRQDQLFCNPVAKTLLQFP
jgi:hypothetical protein